MVNASLDFPAVIKNLGLSGINIKAIAVIKPGIPHTAKKKFQECSSEGE